MHDFTGWRGHEWPPWGKTLGQENAPTRFELPLADFALVYEGPAQMPPPFRLVSHEEMLAIEARQAREKAERDARCETKQ